MLLVLALAKDLINTLRVELPTVLTERFVPPCNNKVPVRLFTLSGPKFMSI